MKKTASRLALAAGFGLVASSAFAADLGGNCCADLEERIAELEATTVRKGNRVVSLEVSGHVHQAIMFFDVDAGANSERNEYIGTPNTSRSRFRFKGAAKISSDLSAGYLLEIGVRSNGLSATDQNNPRVSQGLDIRHEALYIDSKRYGRVWLGQTAEAIEGITEINLGGALNNSPDFLLAGPGSMLSTAGAEATEFVGVTGEQAGEGNRVEMIRYISPTLMGFTFSASWGEDDTWSVAGRYAGEFNGIRVAGGIGYKDIVDDVAGSAFNTNDGYQLGMSASVLHVPTGLYLTGQYGENGDDVRDETDHNWYVTAGIARKFIALGRTNIYGKYGEYDRDIGTLTSNTAVAAVSAESLGYGIGIEQKVDSAAMDLYVVWNHFEGEAFSTGGQVVDTIDIDSVTVGARIQF
ncbi:MAG: hypothetical protein AAFY53_05870 [Pseudomonadota bacterium]